MAHDIPKFSGSQTQKHTRTRTGTGTGTRTRTHTYAHSWSRLTFSYLVLILRKTLGGVGWAGVGCQRSHTHTHTLAHMFVEYQFMDIYGCLGPGGLTILIQGWSHTFAALTPHVLCSSAVSIAEVSMLCLKSPFLFWKISLFLQILRFSWLQHVPCFHPHVPRHFRWGQGGCCLQRPTLGLRVEQLPALKYSGL